MVAAALVLAVAIAIAGPWVKRRPGWREIGVGIGVAFAYLFSWLRIVSPEERTHLIEYSVVTVLVHQALVERQRHGRRVPKPALLTLAVVVLLGWLDEGIQSLLPNRVYDLRDVGFNALAGLMAIAAILALNRARRWDVFRRLR